jgi:hypothetical protein
MKGVLVVVPARAFTGPSKHAAYPGNGTKGDAMDSITHNAHAIGVSVARPRLLAAAPIVAVSDELDRHVADLTRLAPTSDATVALTHYRDKLAAALHHARQLELFVSVVVASAVLGKSVSMVTHLCRTGALNAKKVGGTWEIDRVDLERLREDGVASVRAD